jgi:hypothetical protein
MIWARHLKLFTKLGVAALALGALATSGNAQNVYQGKFTLPFETHWGGATLPAGDYTFTMSSAMSDYRLIIRGQVNAIIMATSTDDRPSRHSMPRSWEGLLSTPLPHKSTRDTKKPIKRRCHRRRPRHRPVKTELPSQSTLRVAERRSPAGHCKRRGQKASGWVPGKAHKRSGVA